jgi:tetratricopeptide (TPR) repeat protein
LEAIVDHLPERGLNSYLLPLSRAWAKMGEGKIDLALAQLAGLDHIAGLGVLRQFNAGLINDLADRHQAAEQAFRATLSTAAGRTLRTEAVVASFFHRIGKDDEAHQLLAAFRHEHPDLPDLAISEQRLVDSPQAGLAEGYFGVAGTLRQANAADLALLFCELALDLKPDFPLAQLMTGDILTGLGQFDAANRAYRSLPADSPFVPSATLRVARNLESTKDLDGAAALLRALAQRQPQRPDALLALGDMWRRQKRWLDAVHAYDQALARIDGDDRSQWPAFYARGVALERANQWSRAEADLLHALDLQPDEPEVLNYLGYSWIEQSANLPRATAMIEKAVSLRPADGFIVDSLGWAFYRSGDFPRAVETLQKAVTLEPGDAAINDHLGDALWRAGRPEEARFQWQHALLSDPDPELRTQVADKLKRDQLPDAVIAPAEPSQ